MNTFKSSRLTYRAIEETEVDRSFIHTLRLDASALANTNPRLLRPARKPDSDAFTKVLANDVLLGVMICLPASTAPLTEPIGYIALGTVKGMEHSRCAEISLQIKAEEQGKSYGTEAIQWCLAWAFLHAGLHRVRIVCFSYNTGAKALYEKLGFILEGRQRECLWHAGGWHDFIEFGMLEGEWRERYRGVQDKGQVVE
jgi:RimJ/RimL family protein N-acetyltransferase